MAVFVQDVVKESGNNLYVQMKKEDMCILKEIVSITWNHQFMVQMFRFASNELIRTFRLPMNVLQQGVIKIPKKAAVNVGEMILLKIEEKEEWIYKETVQPAAQKYFVTLQEVL